MLEVVPRPNGSIVGVSGDGDVIQLDKADVVIHVLDHSKIGLEICGALQVDPQKSSTNASSSAMPLGTFVRGSIRHPVALILCAEDDEFQTAIHRLLDGATNPGIILVPTARLIAGRPRRVIRDMGFCVVALSDILRLAPDGRFVSTTGPGVALLQASQAASGVAPKPDGIYPPNTVVWMGVEHRCDLTKREVKFLEVGLFNREIEVRSLMHPRTGLIWKTTYTRSRLHRNRITAFLSRLSDKLLKADPALPFHFALPRERDYVVRNEASQSR